MALETLRQKKYINGKMYKFAVYENRIRVAIDGVEQPNLTQINDTDQNQRWNLNELISKIKRDSYNKIFNN